MQLDEASIVGFPQDAPWAAEAINHVLDGILNEKAVHICFGNYGGQPMLRGFWRDLIPFLNSLRTDHLVLEFARRGYEELAVFNELDPKIRLGIGVIDIKDNEVESPRTDRFADRENCEDDWVPTACITCIRTADSGCCSGAWWTARCGRWWKGEICSRGASRKFARACGYVRIVGELTVEDEKAAVRAAIFTHLSGIVLAPTVAALADRGVFRLFGSSSAWITLGRNLRAHSCESRIFARGAAFAGFVWVAAPANNGESVS